MVPHPAHPADQGRHQAAAPAAAPVALPALLPALAGSSWRSGSSWVSGFTLSKKIKCPESRSAKKFYMVGRHFFLLLLNFSAWLCLGPA